MVKKVKITKCKTAFFLTRSALEKMRIHVNKKDMLTQNIFVKIKYNKIYKNIMLLIKYYNIEESEGI